MYHLHLSTGSRGGGQSAKAKSDYVTRQGKYENQEDKCVYTFSGNMPNFAEEDPTEYWQAADNHERANGRLYTEIEIALPQEMKPHEYCGLASRMTAQIVNERNLPYTMAVHEGRGDNPHVHIVISERANDGIDRDAEQWFKRANKQEPELGGAAKDREIQQKEWLQGVREDWQEIANESLRVWGYEKRIDHRTLQEQGIDREPQQHIGPAAWNMGQDDIDTERMDEHRQQQEQLEREKELAQELKSVEQDLIELHVKIDQEEEREAQRELKLERNQDRGLGW